MKFRLKRTFTLVSLLALGAALIPSYGLADEVKGRQQQSSASGGSVQQISPARDPQARAALRLITRGLLDGRMLSNGELTVRPNQPMTAGAVMDLLVRAVGRTALERNLAMKTRGGAADKEWLQQALVAARHKLERWGAPSRPGDGESFARQPMSANESIAMLAIAFGVEPRARRAWPDNVMTSAVAAGMISAGDLQAVSKNDNSSGLVFYLFDRAFYNYDLGSGKTVYTKYDPGALAIDPYPVETTLDQVTLKGSVTNASASGLQIAAGASAQTVVVGTDGKWSVTVPLSMGANLIKLQWMGTDGFLYMNDPPVIVTRLAGPSLRPAPATYTRDAGAR